MSDKEDTALELVDIEHRNWIMLHLHLQGESARKIGKELGVAHTTVTRYLATPEAQAKIIEFREQLGNFFTAQVEAANIVALRNAVTIAADADADELVRLKASELILNYTSKLTQLGRSANLETSTRPQKSKSGGGDSALSLLDDYDK